MIKFDACFIGETKNKLNPGFNYIIKIEDPKVKKITKDSPNEDFANAIIQLSNEPESNGSCIEGIALRFPLWVHAVVDESKPTWESTYYQKVSDFNKDWIAIELLDKTLEPQK